MRYQSLHKRIGCLLLAGFLMLGITGCGGADGSGSTENTEDAGNREIALTGEMVPVANFQEVKSDLSKLEHYVWQGESLIYLERVWDHGMSQGTLYQVNLDGTGSPEALYKGISEEHSILDFGMGQDGCFYFLERKSEEDGTGTLYLRKMDGDLQEVWLQELEHGDFHTAAQSMAYFSDMHVDIEGRLLLTDHDDRGYFFDAEGRYMGCDAIQVSQGDIIDGGEQGVFLIRQDWNGSSLMNYQFQRADMDKGRMGAVETRDLSVTKTGGLENGSVLSGYGMGILISMENRLYSYEYDTGEYTELLDWQKLGVDGSAISAVRLLAKELPLENLGGYTAQLQAASMEDGTSPENVPEMSPVLEALSYKWSSSVPPEIVHVGHMDRGYVPEKQTVTLGLASVSTTRLGQMVRRFNRSSMEYEVITKSYEDMDAFTEDLLFHPEGVADILELSWGDRDMLDEKGLLEDLRPYMQASGVVDEEDIMEAVRDACETDGKLTSMMSGFYIQTIHTTAETIPTDGWTYDQLFELAGNHPGTKLLDVYTYNSVWRLLEFTLDSYVDWEKGECHYDSPEFKRLLENVRGLSYPENEERQTVFYNDEEARKFLDQEYLLQYNMYLCPYDHSKVQFQYRDKAWDVGYPTRDGELCYLMNPLMQFSIYSNSPNKEGAWAFMEFLLSEEEQSWYGSDLGGFPVRKDAFEAYLERPYHAVYNMADDHTSEETIRMLRDMMEHLRMSQIVRNGEISGIVAEETQAYFAGDKTVEQCVEIIQNRVQLYLDENF
ncbi:MAG: extracellular solute-binding protein [Lachnospiraceae bacterium]|nr:extracellular solute-binding protein [Lachnospiraceae bacterium]MCM1239907.1 extracellular solute-binding protein [Lachnospiraceae bacterium]